MITVDFKRLGIESDFHILDVGCGSGRHTGEATRFKEVIVAGIDIDFKDLTQAKKRIEFHKDAGEYNGKATGLFVADSLHLPFADKVFDLVICSEVLEHIPDHKIAIKEMIRVLKQGGNIVVSVPRYFPERICWALSKEYNKASRGHIRIYKKKDLLSILEDEGLKLWGSHFAHSLHTPYWWLKCLVGPARDDIFLVNLYHRFLVWDLMKKPWVTLFFDKLLNPVIGKSAVFYLRK